jgi:hypothetical protein
MIIKAKWVGLFGASAITAWPFVFVDGEPSESIMVHERVHLAQQRRWAIYGLGVGLLAWHLLYLLALPAGWNPWRKRWETEAYRANGIGEDRIKAILRARPYYLWWQ